MVRLFPPNPGPSSPVEVGPLYSVSPLLVSPSVNESLTDGVGHHDPGPSKDSKRLKSPSFSVSHDKMVPLRRVFSRIVSHDQFLGQRRRSQV